MLPDAVETVKLVVPPWLTVLEVGLIEPLPLPATDARPITRRMLDMMFPCALIQGTLYKGLITHIYI